MDLPVEMCEAEQEAVFHSVEDLPLIAHIPEGEFLPWVLEHADQLRSGGCQPMDLFQSFLALRGKGGYKGWVREWNGNQSGENYGGLGLGLGLGLVTNAHYHTVKLTPKDCQTDRRADSDTGRQTDRRTSSPSPLVSRPSPTRQVGISRTHGPRTPPHIV
jgi:hypothetical protein